MSMINMGAQKLPSVLSLIIEDYAISTTTRRETFEHELFVAYMLGVYGNRIAVMFVNGDVHDEMSGRELLNAVMSPDVEISEDELKETYEECCGDFCYTNKMCENMLFYNTYMYADFWEKNKHENSFAYKLSLLPDKLHEYNIAYMSSCELGYDRIDSYIGSVSLRYLLYCNDAPGFEYLLGLFMLNPDKKTYTYASRAFAIKHILPAIGMCGIAYDIVSKNNDLCEVELYGQPYFDKKIYN